MRISHLVLGFAAAAFALLPAAPAYAAGGIEVSDNGTAFAPALSGPLFSSLGKLVPMESTSSRFWVRNTSTTDAYLSITLSDAIWSDPSYASALSVAASVPSTSGTAISLSSGATCPVLLEGVSLAAGQSVPVTAILALGDLSGTTGQTSTASLNLAVHLVEATATGPAGTTCATGPGTVVIPVSPVSVPATAAEGSDDAEGDGSETTAPDAPSDSFATVLANTLSSFDSGMLVMVAAAVPLGAAAYLLLGLLRRRPDDTAEEDSQ